MSNATKYNLNSELQHVQATFMKTEKTVEKMRKFKEERLEEFKESRRVWCGDRFVPVGKNRGKSAETKNKPRKSVKAGNMSTVFLERMHEDT